MSEETQTEEETVAVSTAGAFGDDDLGRLQGILFGDHARKTAERIDTLEQALLGVISDLRSHVDAEFAALNKRIDSEADTRAKAVTNVRDRLKEESRTRTSAEKALRKDLDRSHENLTQAVDTLEQRSTSSLDAARSEIAAEVESAVQGLSDSKVSRNDLVRAFRQAVEEFTDD